MDRASERGARGILRIPDLAGLVYLIVAEAKIGGWSRKKVAGNGQGISVVICNAYPTEVWA